jgi:hypothetical protein
MKREGGWEAGYCSKTVSDVAIDVCLLFNFVVFFSTTNLHFLFVKLN